MDILIRTPIWNKTIIDPVNGNSVVSTLDVNIQQVIEKYISAFDTAMSKKTSKKKIRKKMRRKTPPRQKR